MEKLIIETNGAPRALGPYSQGVIAGDWFFVSGQLGIDPLTGEMVAGGAAAEADQALKNVRAILRSAGAEMNQVVRVTLYLKDLDNFSQVNDIFSKYFVTTPPARVTIGVAGLPKDAQVEVEAQAYLGN
jgi:2-iminobutanoate/2-iminopropanoate deaminase